MKKVIVDSSVLIPLLRIGKLSLLKSLFKTIYITKDIYNEILEGKTGKDEFKESCEDWIITKDVEFKDAKDLAKNNEIEIADASLIILTEKINGILLSNYLALIMVLKSKNIKYMWLTTFILECIKRKLILKNKGKEILSDLVGSGMHLRNDVFVAILSEIDKL